ncbi:hypothetical protein [Segatella bryantii]|uniref:hypothetical protein n=1 Tax=Segatella bryantii TaxID=77095 RepID=UPI000B963961|nr:hypothetical protein [Segatella bryantii]UKK82166.1 hypothetical protein L6474_13865 [Segatella bryantii]
MFNFLALSNLNVNAEAQDYIMRPNDNYDSWSWGTPIFATDGMPEDVYCPPAIVWTYKETTSSTSANGNLNGSFNNGVISAGGSVGGQTGGDTRTECIMTFQIPEHKGTQCVGSWGACKSIKCGEAYGHPY